MHSEFHISTYKFKAYSLTGLAPGGRFLFNLFKRLCVSSVNSPLKKKEINNRTKRLNRNHSPLLPFGDATVP